MDSFKKMKMTNRNKKNKCQTILNDRCGGKGLKKAHACPYLTRIGDTRRKCFCCRECTQLCVNDI